MSRRLHYRGISISIKGVFFSIKKDDNLLLVCKIPQDVVLDSFSQEIVVFLLSGLGARKFSCVMQRPPSCEQTNKN